MPVPVILVISCGVGPAAGLDEPVPAVAILVVAALAGAPAALLEVVLAASGDPLPPTALLHPTRSAAVAAQAATAAVVVLRNRVAAFTQFSWGSRSRSPSATAQTYPIGPT